MPRAKRKINWIAQATKATESHQQRLQDYTEKQINRPQTQLEAFAEAALIAGEYTNSRSKYGW